MICVGNVIIFEMRRHNAAFCATCFVHYTRQQVRKAIEDYEMFQPTDRVLEIGTGSGYQTAVLAQLVKTVFTVERIYRLQQRARRCLQELHLRNVRMKHSDGGWGWENYAPYDGIIVTAAPNEVPQALLDQLALGGVMVIPIGDGRDQILQRITRTETGNQIENIEPVIFVPLLAGVTDG